MWNLTYTNRVCNEHERFKDHKVHVNKLLVVNSYLDTKPPYKPLFLVNKCNRTQNELDKNLKINYENRNLLGKIKTIEKKHSLYHPSKIVVKDCPAYNKTNFVKNTYQKRIDNENMNMYFRLKSAKPTYKTSRLESDYKKAQYIENQIKFKHTNPNMFFETPEKFKNKLFQEINTALRPNFSATTKSRFYDGNVTSYSNFNKTNRPSTSVGFGNNKNSLRNNEYYQGRSKNNEIQYALDC